MKRQVIKTSDGSSTIYIPEMDENYHSTHGAIQEAEHVFIQYGLKSIEENGASAISIFEMGFGTGLNAFLTKIRAKTQITYVGIEAFPVSEDELKAMNYVEQLGTEFKNDFDAIHNAQWNQLVEIDSNF